MRTWNHKKMLYFSWYLKDQTQQNSWYYTLLADHVSTLGPNSIVYRRLQQMADPIKVS